MKRERPKKEKKKRRIAQSQCLDFYVRINSIDENGIAEIEYNRKEKALVSFMKIEGIDIFHYSEADRISVCNNYAAGTTALRLPHKYVFTSRHPDLKSNIDFISYKINNSEGFGTVLLEKEREKLEYNADYHNDNLAYVLVFGEKDGKEKLIKNTSDYISYMIDTTVTRCTREEIYALVKKYLSCADVSGTPDSYLPSKVVKHQGYSEIDGKYVTSIIVNDYPATLRELELTDLFQNLNNVTITIDVSTKDRSVVRKELANSLKELESRFLINRSEDEDADTQIELEKLRAIRDSISIGNESMMYITLRIIVSESSLKELNDKVDTINKILDNEGMSAFVPINEMRDELVSMLRSSNIVSTPFPLQDTFKHQYPFYYQEHIDGHAGIFGYTGTKGIVAIDFFKKDSYRQSYDMMFMGLKGSGKSVTLKSLARDFVSLGNKIMILDVEGEYHDLAKVFNGQVIKLDKNSTINVFQMRKTIDSSKEEEAAGNETNFTAEISRIMTFFHQYIPNIEVVEAQLLNDLIYKTFIDMHITPKTNVLELSPQDFPVCSDVLKKLRSILYINGKNGAVNKELSERYRNAYENLEAYLKPIAEGTYSTMFNGFTNVNIDESNMIVFDVKSISEFENNIYNAQLFNILSIMWSETCLNVEYNNRINNPNDRRFVVSLIDEAHRFINANSYHVTNFISQLLRRSRKYDAGLWFASQSVSDFNPSANSEAAELVRSIFSLVQYKIILKQSIETIKDLTVSFPQFTQSELASTASFSPGEMLISLGAGRQKLHCLRKVDEATLLYIGSSRDREQIIHSAFNKLYYEHTKEEYARLISNNEQKFRNGFTNEVLTTLGYKATDSKHLTSIVYYYVQKLVDEFLELNGGR